MLMKICIAFVVALGFSLSVPSSSFAQDKDKATTTQHKKAKKGHAEDVHWNRVPKSASKKPKKGHADDVHNR